MDESVSGQAPVLLYGRLEVARAIRLRCAAALSDCAAARPVVSNSSQAAMASHQQSTRTGMTKSFRSAPACRRVSILAAGLIGSSAMSRGTPVVVTMLAAAAGKCAGTLAGLL